MSIFKKINLAGWIFIAMVAGILAGLACLSMPEIASNYLKPFGTIFVNLLKFIVVPIVLLSVICGMITMEDVKKIGSVGVKTFVYYLATTLIAVIIGLLVATAFKGAFPLLDTSDAIFEPKTASLMDTITSIFPSNMWEALSSANMLQVIVIALLIGAGILFTGEKAQPFTAVIESANEVFTKIMMGIIKCSPIGVFCLMADVVATNGPAIIGSLAAVLAAAYVGYLVHLVITYSISLKALGRINPLVFLKNMVPAIIFAFSSASSLATLPLTKECASKSGANPEYSSFILPLGATINMDGTAIYMGVATIFIATCFGIELDLSQLAMVSLTATLASIGTAGVSGSGVIILTMVLESVGLPIEGMALILGIDKIFDMGRTTLNVIGDAVCSVVITRIEDGQLHNIKQ